MSWVNTVLSAAQRLGVTQEALLAAAGIAPAELREERWPIDHITRLWRAAAQLTGDPGFGLKAGEAYLSQSGSLSPATVTQGQLDVNFAQRSFATQVQVKLGNGGGLEGVNAALGALTVIVVFTLILPNYSTSAAGPVAISRPKIEPRARGSCRGAVMPEVPK